MRNLRLALVLAAGVAGLALFTSGCSGSSGGSSSGAGRQSAPSSSSSHSAVDTAQALRSCLRGKGMDVPDLKPGEDPQSQALGQPQGVSLEQWQAALKSCGAKSAGGTGAGGGNGQQAQDQRVKIAECMRGKGFDMPDPKAGQQGGAFSLPQGADQSKFLAALNACAA